MKESPKNTFPWNHSDNDDNSDASKNSQDKLSRTQVDFGILFDVDGVIARGSNPLDPAMKAIQLLKDESGQMRVPIAFVTNACNRSEDKARQIEKWLGIKVTSEMVIHAQSPLAVMTDLHEKFILVIGQEHAQEIAKDLGFTNTCTLDDVKEAYPLLDMVDHNNRAKVASGYVEKDFPRIEGAVLLGEPVRWEGHLQILVDLLLTDGKPTSAPETPDIVQSLPLIACNMDLQFMAEACLPRFGHGAFLVCLEALYQKITGHQLQYKALVGKPCEITYRFAEHTICQQARQLGIVKPIRKLYFVGDNPQVDIVGANLYHKYVQSRWNGEENGNDQDLPASRCIPNDVQFEKQTVHTVKCVLVNTGVYRRESMDLADDTLNHGHRDIENDTSLKEPTNISEDVFDGVKHILSLEDLP